jgi:hypothetical protein
VLDVGAIPANCRNIGGALVEKPISTGNAREAGGVLSDDGAVVLIGIHFCVHCSVAPQMFSKQSSRRVRHFVRVDDGAQGVIEANHKSRPVFTLFQSDLRRLPFGDIHDQADHPCLPGKGILDGITPFLQPRHAALLGPDNSKIGLKAFAAAGRRLHSPPVSVQVVRINQTEKRRHAAQRVGLRNPEEVSDRAESGDGAGQRIPLQNRHLCGGQRGLEPLLSSRELPLKLFTLDLRVHARD